MLEKNLEAVPNPLSRPLGMILNLVEKPYIQKLAVENENQASLGFLKEIGFNLNIICDAQTQAVLKSEPIILVINHPNGLITLVIRAVMAILEVKKNCVILSNVYPVGLDPSLKINTIELAPPI